MLLSGHGRSTTQTKPLCKHVCTQPKTRALSKPIRTNIPILRLLWVIAASLPIAALIQPCFSCLLVKKKRRCSMMELSLLSDSSQCNTKPCFLEPPWKAPILIQAHPKMPLTEIPIPRFSLVWGLCHCKGPGNLILLNVSVFQGVCGWRALARETLSPQNIHLRTTGFLTYLQPPKHPVPAS